jgi:signal transduction histidine kinase
MLLAGKGEIETRLGRTRYFVAPLGPPLRRLSVITFVPAPETPYAVRTLAGSVALLTALLIGAAVLVTIALTRAVQADVDHMQQRIVEMASTEAKPAGEPIPIRAIDQTAVLATAFNVLVERFAEAERAYQRDLSQALAYDRERAEFLAALSHELRTPLNAILGFADVLLSEVDGPLSTENRESLTVIRSSGQHLRALIDDILDLSALESGELHLSFQNINVFAVATEVVREARATVKSRPLAVQMAGDPVTAWADARRLRQILTNVVGNAIKFTQQGFVMVHVEARGDEVVLVTVEDTGPGIAPDDVSAIFDEFHQSGESSARRVGTGLGLAITRRLVAMHHGALWVDSVLGEGSRFMIALPAKPDRWVERTGGEQLRISHIPSAPPERTS